MYNIDPKTIQQAAELKYGEGVNISTPYWVDSECVRVGIHLPSGVSFGANFYYKEGSFK